MFREQAMLRGLDTSDLLISHLSNTHARPGCLLGQLPSMLTQAERSNHSAALPTGTNDLHCGWQGWWRVLDQRSNASAQRWWVTAVRYPLARPRHVASPGCRPAAWLLLCTWFYLCLQRICDTWGARLCTHCSCFICSLSPETKRIQARPRDAFHSSKEFMCKKFMKTSYWLVSFGKLNFLIWGKKQTNKKNISASIFSYVIFKWCMWSSWFQTHQFCTPSSPFIFLLRFLGIPGGGWRTLLRMVPEAPLYSAPALATPVTAGAQIAIVFPKAHLVLH